MGSTCPNKNNTIFVKLCIFVISYKKHPSHPLISNEFWEFARCGNTTPLLKFFKEIDNTHFVSTVHIPHFSIWFYLLLIITKTIYENLDSSSITVIFLLR